MKIETKTNQPTKQVTMVVVKEDVEVKVEGDPSKEDVIAKTGSSHTHLHAQPPWDLSKVSPINGLHYYPK